MWVKFREEDLEGNEKRLVFEKNVELFDLSYLGLMVERRGTREEREWREGDERGGGGGGGGEKLRSHVIPCLCVRRSIHLERYISSLLYI